MRIHENEEIIFTEICKPYNVSRETFEKLVSYKNLLIKWQKAINLVSRGTLDDFWTRHVLDSLQIIKYINGKRILDIGSGGGFPGMIIALCGNADNEIQFDVTCIDSDSRKIIFLEEVARITKTNVNLKNIRIEQLKDNNFDTVCARGFSSLSELISLTNRFSSKKYGVFLKGIKIQSEISEASKFFKFKYDIFKSKVDKSGSIIVVSEIVKNT